MSLLIEISDEYEPRVKEAVMAALVALQSRVTVQVITQTLETLGVEGVVGLLQNFKDDLGPVINELDLAIRESGISTVKMIPKAALTNPSFQFDMFSEHTANYIRQYRLNLINQITEETRNAVRQSVLEGFQLGVNPRKTARQIKDSLGLTPYQERAVRNYRKALEELDKNALDRALRDKRFDRSFIAAMRNSKPLTPDQIDRMVQRYRERYIAYRAEVIARTESMRAVSVGNRAAMQQMLSSGAVDIDKVRRQWVYTHDNRTRNAHRGIPELNKGGVRLDGEYKTSLGPLAYPRDPSGLPENTIQCRCTERYFIAEGV